MNLQDLFKLSKLESLKALQLYAKQLVHSMQVGGHQSAKRGSGIAFKEYKNYTIGDNLKQLDWKYFARTDHYMIKEAEVERLQEYLFVLDKSLSMNFERGGVSKLNYAKAITASLAYIADRQHDAYSIFKSPSRSNDYTAFVHQCLNEEASAEYSSVEMMAVDQRRNKATTFIMTDAYCDIDSLDSILKKWSFAADQVVFIHLLFDTELTLSFEKQQYRFQDLETQRTIEVNTKEQLAAYQDQLNEWQNQVKTSCAKYQVQYHHYDGQQALNGFLLNIVNSINQSS